MRGSSNRGPAEEPEPGASLLAAERGVCFGPIFFLRQLGGLVRDRCPDPSEDVPGVAILLADGSELDLCHIIGVTPKWIAMAVYQTDRGDAARRMRTELVPYAMITRVVIRTDRAGGPHRMGFDVERRPTVETSAPEAAGRSSEAALGAVARRRAGRSRS